jgi:hypothetical protein
MVNTIKSTPDLSVTAQPNKIKQQVIELIRSLRNTIIHCPAFVWNFEVKYLLFLRTLSFKRRDGPAAE